MTESQLGRPVGVTVRAGGVVLPWLGRPVWALPSATGCFVGSDAGEWAALGPGEAGSSEGLGPCSAAVVDGDRLLVAAYGGEVWGRAASWQAAGGALEGPAVLALAATPSGVCAGDAGGRLWLVDGARGGERAGGECDGVVTALVAAGGGLAALASGSLWTTPWPGEADSLRRASVNIGRACGLLAGDGGRLAVWGEDTCVWLDPSGRELSRSGPMASIRNIVLLSGAPGLAVLSDDGELTLLDTGLAQPRVIALPKSSAPIAGVCALPRGELATWTDDGALYRLDGRGVRWLADRDVVLACAGGDGGLWIVRAAATGTGASAEREAL